MKRLAVVALTRVRFERYDVNTFAGNTAYRRYVGGRGFRPIPSFVGVVDDRTVYRSPGLPPRIDRFVEQLRAEGDWYRLLLAPRRRQARCRRLFRLTTVSRVMLDCSTSSVV